MKRNNFNSFNVIATILWAILTILYLNNVMGLISTTTDAMDNKYIGNITIAGYIVEIVLYLLIACGFLLSALAYIKSSIDLAIKGARISMLGYIVLIGLIVYAYFANANFIDTSSIKDDAKIMVLIILGALILGVIMYFSNLGKTKAANDKKLSGIVPGLLLFVALILEIFVKAKFEIKLEFGKATLMGASVGGMILMIVAVLSSALAIYCGSNGKFVLNKNDSDYSASTLKMQDDEYNGD